MNPYTLKTTVDVSDRSKEIVWESLANNGDRNAHRIIVEVVDGKTPVDLSAYQSTLQVLRGDGATRYIDATVDEDGCAAAVLDASCYEIVGRLVCTMVIRDTAADMIFSAARIFLEVTEKNGQAVIDPNNVIPTLSDLLEQIENMREATGEANDAADNANTAADAANSAASQANAGEKSRQTAEAARVEAEKKRVSAEADRSSAEALRETAEQKRNTAEQDREEAEQGRAAGEAAREKAELGRADAEQGRDDAEQARVKAESGRVSSESARETAEKSRSEQAKENKAIADRLSEVELVYETLPPSEDGYGRIEQTEKKTTFFFGVPASNFAYATFWIDLETRTLMMRTPNGFSAIGFSIKDRQLTVTING